LRDLFKGFTFFFNRETPFYSLEYLVISCGGVVVFDESYKKITHHVIDRPVLKPIKTWDYVVPQWVYDCLNNVILLPTSQYQPGKPAPPHLSPFVENKAEGYLPRRQEEINEIKGVKEEVFVPEADDEVLPQDSDSEEVEEGGKFDDESSDEDDNVANEKEREKK